jgi:hypothetical protein
MAAYHLTARLLSSAARRSRSSSSLYHSPSEGAVFFSVLIAVTTFHCQPDRATRWRRAPHEPNNSFAKLGVYTGRLLKGEKPADSGNSRIKLHYMPVYAVGAQPSLQLILNVGSLRWNNTGPSADFLADEVGEFLTGHVRREPDEERRQQQEREREQRQAGGD